MTDITYIRTWQIWMSPAVVMDLFSREVVGRGGGTAIQTALAPNSSKPLASASALASACPLNTGNSTGRITGDKPRSVFARAVSSTLALVGKTEGSVLTVRAATSNRHVAGRQLDVTELSSAVQTHHDGHEKLLRTDQFMVYANRGRWLERQRRP